MSVPRLCGLIALLSAVPACDDPSVVQYDCTFSSVRQGSERLWVVRLGPEAAPVPVAFRHLPEQTHDVAMAPELAAWLGDGSRRPDRLVVSIDPDAVVYTRPSGAAIVRLVEDLGLLGSPRLVSAFVRPAGPAETAAVIGCEQADASTLVIVLEQGGANRVMRNGDCVIATYLSPQDSLRVAERIGFALAGVY